MKVSLVLVLFSCVTTVIPQTNSLITLCPKYIKIQDQLLALADAIQKVNATLCQNIATSCSQGNSGQIKAADSAIKTQLMQDINTGTSCGLIIEELCCIFGFVQSINCISSNPINPCVELVVRHINNAIIDVLQQMKIVDSYSDCISNLNDVIVQFQTKSAACHPVTNPGLCTALSSACLTQCTNLGTVETLVRNVISGLRVLLGNILGPVCILLNGVLGGFFGLILPGLNCTLVNNLIAPLTTVLLGPYNKLLADITQSNTGNITTDCNQLVTLLNCVVTKLLILATDRTLKSNPCICGVLSPIINQILALVNTILLLLIRTTGVTVAEQQCRTSLYAMHLQLRLFFNCCPNNTTNICNITLGIPLPTTAPMTTPATIIIPCIMLQDGSKCANTTHCINFCCNTENPIWSGGIYYCVGCYTKNDVCMPTETAGEYYCSEACCSFCDQCFTCV